MNIVIPIDYFSRQLGLIVLNLTVPSRKCRFLLPSSGAEIGYQTVKHHVIKISTPKTDSDISRMLRDLIYETLPNSFYINRL